MNKVRVGAADRVVPTFLGPVIVHLWYMHCPHCQVLEWDRHWGCAMYRAWQHAPGVCGEISRIEVK